MLQAAMDLAPGRPSCSLSCRSWVAELRTQRGLHTVTALLGPFHPRCRRSGPPLSNPHIIARTQDSPPPPIPNTHGQELGLFLTTEGDLDSSAAWASLRPMPGPSIVDGTTRLSKQLLGLERSVVEPVQVCA